MAEAKIIQIVAIVETPPGFRADKEAHWPGKRREPDMTKLRNFLRDENGATAIEYGLIAAGISVAIIVAVQDVGSNLDELYERIAAAFP
jgi:pilus assembly protein Flp/PilA